MTSLAYYATLSNQSGIALRSTDGSVHFQAERTCLWTQLCDADTSRLHLHGRVDLADAQALVDGNLVYRTSRTLQEVA
jgi:hypothetical protein